MEIRCFNESDTPSVIELWSQCGLIRPWNDPHKDIQRKLGEQPELFLVGTLGSVVIGSAMAGFDGHRGWLYYLAVSPHAQRQSFGRQLVAAIEARLFERGCPKLNLLVRSSNAQVIAFYRELGYLEDAVVCLGRRLIPDEVDESPPS